MVYDGFTVAFTTSRDAGMLTSHKDTQISLVKLATRISPIILIKKGERLNVPFSWYRVNCDEHSRPENCCKCK